MHLYDSENTHSFFRRKIDKERILAYREALKFVTERIKGACESRGGSYMLVPSYAPLFDVFFGEMEDLGVVK